MPLQECSPCGKGATFLDSLSSSIERALWKDQLRTCCIQHTDCKAEIQILHIWEEHKTTKPSANLYMLQTNDIQNNKEQKDVIGGIGSTPGSCLSKGSLVFAPKQKLLFPSATIQAPPLQLRCAEVEDLPGPVALQAHIEVCVL